MRRFLITYLYIPLKSIFAYILFVREFFIFRKKSGTRFPVLWKNRFPQLLDRKSTTPFDTHYVYHPAWAARIVRQLNPKKHIDIASTLTFSSMLSAFIPTEFYDLRPANLKLSNLLSESGDLMSLPFPDNSIESLSCMHTVEHVGLGRYGDPMDPDGDLKAIHELKRVTAKGGSILFVVPTGKSRVAFNAHRIYSYSQVLEYFDGFTLKDFFLVPDNALTAGPIENATKEDADKQKYGCGCFWFIKETSS